MDLSSILIDDIMKSVEHDVKDLYGVQRSKVISVYLLWFCSVLDKDSF